MTRANTEVRIFLCVYDSSLQVSPYAVLRLVVYQSLMPGLSTVLSPNNMMLSQDGRQRSPGKMPTVQPSQP